MGTRLYPITKNEASLEIMAGVKPGTAQRLKELEKQYQGANLCDVLFRPGNGDLQSFDHFLTFGWGKVAEYKSPCGHETDPKEYAILLVKQGLDQDNLINAIRLCEGVCWS